MRWLVIGLYFSSIVAVVAQSMGDRLMPHMSQNADKAMQIINQACRGPQIDGSVSGLPGDLHDDVKCQSISIQALACNTLASQAASYLVEVLERKISFNELQSKLDHTVGGLVASSDAALMIARQAAPGTNPIVLIDYVFSNCTALIQR